MFWRILQVGFSWNVRTRMRVNVDGMDGESGGAKREVQLDNGS